MKKLAVFLGIMLSTIFAVASFEAINGSTKLGFFNQIWCSTGTTCSKVGGKMKIVTDAAVTGSVSLDSGETIANAVDDTVEIKSNDEVMTLRVEGFEAKNSILELAADDGDDATDVFSLRSDTSNVFTILNSSTELATLSAVGDWVFKGTTPYLTVGDADAEDAGLIYDGNAQDFNISLDDSADKLVIGLGATAGSTNRMAFNSADLNVVLGDASAADMSFIWDGNAVDYRLGIDDSSDDLSLGVGSTAGTTDALRINSSQVVTFLQDPVFAGTTPYLTVGDAGAEDAGLVYDGNAVDFNVSLDDSADKLVIGLGSTAGTTNRMAFNSADLNIVLGDASAADMSLVYDGNAQDFQIGIDDSTDDLTIGLGVAPGTTDAIRIDENQVVTFVQEVLGLGTDSLSGFLAKQTASTTTGITAVQCGQTFVSNSADVMTLPEASTVLGCRLKFVCGTADDFDVNPADGVDAIGITGALSPSAGDAIRCTDIGAGFVLEAVGANLWAVESTNGTITDVN